MDLVIGLGEIGQPLKDILSVTRSVDGLDMQPKAIDGTIEVMHICFPYSDKFVMYASRYISRFIPKMTIIHSTVMPGTTREISRLTDIPIGYSPVRGRHVSMHRDMMRYNKFVSAPNLESLGNVLDYFDDVGIFIAETMMPVESLELAKLIETTYSGLMIAWSQELDRFSGTYGVSLSQILQFTREVEYLPDHEFYPGYIGGHCILQNFDLLEKIRRSPAIDFIRHSNEMCTDGQKNDRIRHKPKRIESIRND